MMKYLLLLCLLTLAHAQENNPEFFARLNQSLLQDYAAAKHGTIQQLANVIVVSGTTAHWYQHGKPVQEANLVNDNYLFLKSLAHISLSISALRAQANATQAIHYQRYEQMLHEVLPRIVKLPLTPAQRTRAQQLVALDIDLIQRLQQAGANTTAIYTRYYRAAKPLLEAHAADAAAEQLQLLETTISPWLNSLTNAQQQALYVVIGASVTANRHHLLKQFFAHALGTFEDDARLFVTENTFDPDTQLTVLSGYLLETQIGQWLGDKERLHRDITADGAARYLSRH